MGEDHLAEPVSVDVGDEFDIVFEDFPPFGDMEVSFSRDGDSTLVDQGVADAFGQATWGWRVEVEEVGDWMVTGVAAGGECRAELAVAVIGAVPSPSPSPSTPIPSVSPAPSPHASPTPTPVPTPTPTVAPTSAASPGITPPPTDATTAGAAADRALVPVIAMLAGLGLGSLIVARRRARVR
jgi:hypothetical protein